MSERIVLFIALFFKIIVSTSPLRLFVFKLLVSQLSKIKVCPDPSVINLTNPQTLIHLLAFSDCKPYREPYHMSNTNM